MTQPDPTADLMEELEGPDPDWSMEPESPPNVDRANAMLWKLRRLQREQREDDVIANRQIAQVEEWLARRSEPRQRQILWVESSLKAYHAGVFQRSKQITIALPAGTLKSTAQQPEWQYPDEAAFLAWANKHLKEAVRTPPRPPQPPDEIDRNAVKKLLTQVEGKTKFYGVTPQGETPPGLLVVERDRKYEVVIAPEGD